MTHTEYERACEMCALLFTRQALATPEPTKAWERGQPIREAYEQQMNAIWRRYSQS